MSSHDTEFSTILFVSAWSDVQLSIFNLTLQDIQFSITYHHDEQEPVSQAEVVVAPTRCNSLKEPVRGELTAKAAGVYTLVFNNSYSRWAVWPVCCCAHSSRTGYLGLQSTVCVDQRQHTREVISIREMSHKHSNKHPSHLQ